MVIALFLVVIVLIFTGASRLVYGPYKMSDQRVDIILKSDCFLNHYNCDIICAFDTTCLVKNTFFFILFCKWHLQDPINGNVRIPRWSPVSKQIDELYKKLIIREKIK